MQTRGPGETARTRGTGWPRWPRRSIVTLVAFVPFRSLRAWLTWRRRWRRRRTWLTTEVACHLDAAILNAAGKMDETCADAAIASHAHSDWITNPVDRNESRFHGIDATIGVKIHTDRHFTGQSGCADLVAFDVNHTLGRPSLIDSFAGQVVGI